MNLLVNAVGIKHSGGAVVLLDFLQEALHHSDIDKIYVFCSPRSVRNFDLPLSDKCIELEQAEAERSYLYRAFWSQLILPRITTKLQADAFICMVGIGQGGHSSLHTVFIQQSLPFNQEALQQLSGKEKFRFKVMKLLMKRSSRHAHRIIVQTSIMKDWVSSAFHLPKEKFVVVKPTPPYPVNTDNCEPLTKMLNTKPGSRLLYVGNDAAYKNLSTIFKGMTQLREASPETTLYLTLPDDHPANQLPGVECIGYLSGCKLWKAYELSDVLVMPSFIETVGLPMLEALSVGTAVLAANRPYTQEICGEVALLFDPMSASDFAKKAQYLLTNEEVRTNLSNKGMQMVAELRRQNPYKKMVDVVVNQEINEYVC